MLPKTKIIRTATAFNFDPDEFPGAVNNEDSITVPNEAYTIRELYMRHESGLDLPGSMGSFDFEDLKEEDFDASVPFGPLEDKMWQMEQVAEQIEELQEKAERLQQEYDERQHKEAAEKEAESNMPIEPEEPAEPAEPA